MFCFIPHLLTADNMNTIIVSRELMLQAIERPAIGTSGFRNYFEVAKDAERNVCDFRGVRCLEGEVTSFVFGGPLHCPSKIKFAVSMDWLPSPLRILTLCNVNIGEGWLSRYLPRDLRAMHLLHCLAPQAKWNDGRVFDLRHLPEKMVELRSVFSWSIGQVVLTDLPQSLRVLQLCDQWLQKVQVDALSLPPGLELIYLWNADTAKIRVKSISGPKKRLPVVIGRTDPLRDSPYADFVKSEWEEIKQPIFDRLGRRDVCASEFDAKAAVDLFEC